jgi:hypothetical protein
MLSLINGLMIYSFIIVRKSTALVFHKKIDLNMEGILVELLLPPQISSTQTHSYFSFPNVSEEDVHQYVKPLQPNVPEKNIEYNDRINQWDIDDDVDCEWI